MCSVEKMASSCRCGACSFHWVPLPSDTVGRVVINACVLPLGCLWPYTSLSSPPQLSILLTKTMWISHISFVLSHSALCSTFSSSSSYLLSGCWAGPGILFKVFLPLPHLPIQLLLVYMLQEEEGCLVEEGFSGSFAIAFLKVFCPAWSLPQGWAQEELCPYHRQYF